MHQQYSILEPLDISLHIVGGTSGNRTLSSMVKAMTVNTLAMILAWRPLLAMALGRLVLRVWPSFRRA